MRSNTIRSIRIAGTVARSSQAITARSAPEIHRPHIPSGLNFQPIRMHSRIIPPPILPTQTPERIALDKAAAMHFKEKGGLEDYAKKNNLDEVALINHIVEENSVKAIKALFYRGPFRDYVNYRDKKTNKTPLEIAVGLPETNLIMINELLRYANPNIITANGKPLLSELVQDGKFIIPELLIVEGADVNIIDPKTGKTPLDYAIESKNPITIALLNQYGALTSFDLFSRKSDKEIILVPGPKYTVYPTDRPSSPKAVSYKDPKKTGQNK